MEKTKIEDGDGKTIPKKGDYLGVHYTGILENGDLFDCSRKRASLFEFQVGMGLVITGWDQSLLKFSLGERSKLKIPPKLAYGKTGYPPLIPPNATLNFDIQLFSINGRFALGPDGRRRCGGCLNVEDEKGKYLACGKCMSVFYCNQACQRGNWPSHKRFLFTIAK